MNRVTQETDPLNKSMTIAYDAADRITSRTDRLGRRIDNSYDLAGRLVTETWKDNGGATVNTLTFVYDSEGNQTVAQDSHGAYTLTFDALNRESTIKGLFGVTLTFTYDAVGNRTKVQDSFGGVLTSVYDAANRLTSRQFGGVSQTPLRFDLGYTERNQLATLTRYSDLAGSTKVGESAYGYDTTGRLQNLQHKNGSGTVLENYTYTYDLESRVTTEKLNGANPTTYVYDNTDQLTNDGVKAYSYDANGNRTMTGYTTGTGNRLTNDPFYTYTYDDEGNLIKKSKGASAETWTFTYDNRNQLIGVTERSTDGGGTLLFVGTYVYDVYNNQVQSDEYVNGSGTTTTKSIYAEPGTLFADLTSGNAMQTRYLHQDDAQYSPVVARIDGSGAAWLLEDRLGSTRNVVNGSGTLIGTVAYDGFGNITSESSSANTGKVTFTGLTFLRTASLLNAHYRIYSPLTGNWHQQDPIRWRAGDTKLDRYVKNNPTNATDPSGLRSFAECRRLFTKWVQRCWALFGYAGGPDFDKCYKKAKDWVDKCLGGDNTDPEIPPDPAVPDVDPDTVLPDNDPSIPNDPTIIIPIIIGADFLLTATPAATTPVVTTIVVSAATTSTVSTATTTTVVTTTAITTSAPAAAAVPAAAVPAAAAPAAAAPAAAAPATTAAGVGAGTVLFIGGAVLVAGGSIYAYHKPDVVVNAVGAENVLHYTAWLSFVDKRPPFDRLPKPPHSPDGRPPYELYVLGPANMELAHRIVAAAKAGRPLYYRPTYG